MAGPSVHDALTEPGRLALDEPRDERPSDVSFSYTVGVVLDGDDLGVMAEAVAAPLSVHCTGELPQHEKSCVQRGEE